MTPVERNGYWYELIAEGMWSWRWQQEGENGPVHHAINVRPQHLGRVKQHIRHAAGENPEPQHVAVLIAQFYDREEP